MAHEKYQACIEACNDCAVECEHCASACLEEQDVKRMARCIALDHDCAKICYMASGFMASGSNFADELCKLCADICRACAEECRQHKHMEHCQRCADACERCAQECEQMGSSDKRGMSEAMRAAK
ncbi:MAG: four-helix bundle copper-binding protein [Verrucomicrobiota bacterium]